MIFHSGQGSTLPLSEPTLLQSLQRVLSPQSASAFWQIPERDYLFTNSEKLSEELKANYSQFVIIGIGGSSMGARAIAEISNTENIYFLDNVDSAEFAHIWKKITPNLNKTAFINISKSGSTIEVLWNFSLVENLAQTEFKTSIIPQSFYISELSPNTLSNFAREHNRPLLEVPADIGGRFSVLTPVGLVIAGLCGFNLKDMQKGAARALKDQDKIVNMSDLYLRSFERKENISLFWFYNSKCRWLGGWLQQLWAESLGKKTDRAGNKAPGFSTPVIAIGSCDQHSILQQVAHGPKDKFVCFFSFKSVEQSSYRVQKVLFKEIEFMQNRGYGELITCQSKATFEALKQNGISCELFSVDDSNIAESLAYIFMFFQLVVATIGEHKNINAFDQPGVALGKEITLKMLQN